LERIAKDYRLGKLDRQKAQEQIISRQDKYDNDIGSLIPKAPADKFTIGQTYIDANGNQAIYQGNGVFK